MALEVLEKPKAMERQRTARLKDGRPSDGCGDSPPPESGKTREKVGEAVGMGGQTYYRAKAVVRAVEDESLTEEQRTVAIAAKSDAGEHWPFSRSRRPPRWPTRRDGDMAEWGSFPLPPP
jgi:hypothetical protein